MQQRSFISRVLHYFQHDVWQLQYAGRSALARGFHGAVCRMVLTVRHFVRLDLASRAASLTYSTLFSTIPLLAILFAIAKGFGLESFIESQIREALPGQHAVADTIIGFVLSYLNHTKSGVFVGLGLCLLLYTLLSLAANIEQAFNQIWQIDRERSLLRKITDYTGLLFIFPVLFIITGGLSIFLSSFWDDLRDIVIISSTYALMVELFPYVLMIAVLTGFYVFMPNTRVRFRSALVGGIPAGIAFQVVQYVYIHFQLWVTSYNAIYGSFAALPLFLLWCQISWYICLSGASLCYVDQNLKYFVSGKPLVRISPSHKVFTGLLVMGLACRRFISRKPAADLLTVARELRQPVPLIRDVAQSLQNAGLLVAVSQGSGEGEETYMPAVDAHAISVGEVAQALMNEPKGDVAPPEYKAAWRRFRIMEADMLRQPSARMPVKLFGDSSANDVNQKSKES